MKKNFKRVVALMCSLAMVVAGITYTPKTVSAATSKISVTDVPSGAWGGKKAKYQLGTTSDTSADGKWYLEVSQNQWGNWKGSYQNADNLEGFTFYNEVYNNAGGIFLWSTDLKDEYNLEVGKNYNMSVTISYTGINAAQHNYVLTEGGSKNMSESRTVAKGASEETYTSEVVPTANALVLRISYTTANYQTAEVGTFEVTDITFTEAETTTAALEDWKRVLPHDNSDVVPEAGSLWTLNSNNDSSSQWGESYYRMDTTKDVDDVSRIHFKKAYNAGTCLNDWWWDSVSLFDYGTAYGLEDGETYTGSITINTDTATETYEDGTTGETKNHTLRAIVFGTVYEWELEAGDNTFDINEFKYSEENVDIRFVIVEMPKDAEFYVSSISFTNVNDGWTKVTPNTEYVPSEDETNSPWTLEATYNAADQWGDIRWKADDTASIDEVDGILIKPWTTAMGNHFYWNKATLANYLQSASVTYNGSTSTGLVDGKTYTGTITFNYTAVDETKSPELRCLVPAAGIGEGDADVAVQNGVNTITIPEFDYEAGGNDNIQFELDSLEAGSIFQVTDITFTQTSDWSRVPDEDTAFTLTSTEDSSFTANTDVTYNWSVFAGNWGGEGMKLYYQTDDTDEDGTDDNFKIKVGAGNKWDPACAQIKLPNSEAYKELTDYTNYYMTYKFYSTGAGTVHINQEGYEPTGFERLDVVEGWNTYTKIFTYLPEQDEGNNVYMSLTPTTYEYDADTDTTNVISDGTALANGTVLSNFSVSYSRQDEDGWTLVTDSREESVQKYDDLVNGDLQVYANSYNKGRISYKEDYNADGEDDIAKVGLRLGSTAYSQIDGYSFDESWGAHASIPNRIFYAKTDTNGNALVDGKQYTLRFYYKAELPDGTTMGDGKGLILVQQGYDMNQWHRYAATAGLNMANGTITAATGTSDTSHDSYTKDGGIVFTYDASKTNTTEENNTDVRFDFSEFPEGTIISDISWEFYAPAYTVTINETDSTGTVTSDVVATLAETAGTDTVTSYTFPSTSDSGYSNIVKFVDTTNNVEFAPGQTVNFADLTDNLTVDAIRSFNVTITGYPSDGGTVNTGGTFTLPTIAGVKEYTYNGVTYQPGAQFGPIYSDITFTPVLNETYTVTLVNADDVTDVLDTANVPEDGYYTLPVNDDIKEYTYGGTTSPYVAGTQVGPINEDTTITATLYEYYNVSIVNGNTGDELDADEVKEGETYTLPTIAGVENYTYDGQTYNAGDEIGPFDGDVEITANMITTYTWSVDGVVQDTVAAGTVITLPNGQTAAVKGYILDGADEAFAYKPGTEYTVNSNVNFITITSFAVTMKNGAAMHYADNPDRGIAFGADFTVNDSTANATLMNSKAFNIGIMIATYDTYTERLGEELTLDTWKANQKYVRNVVDNGEGTARWLDEETGAYRCGIKGMSDEWITRDFVGRAYATITYSDGTTETIYAASPNSNTIRSIKTIAQKIKDAAYADCKSDEGRIAIVDYCAAYTD